MSYTQARETEGLLAMETILAVALVISTACMLTGCRLDRDNLKINANEVVSTLSFLVLVGSAAGLWWLFGADFGWCIAARIGMIYVQILFLFVLIYLAIDASDYLNYLRQQRIGLPCCLFHNPDIRIRQGGFWSQRIR